MRPMTYLIVMGVMVFSLGLVAEIIIFTNARNVQDYTVERELPPGLPPADRGSSPPARGKEPGPQAEADDEDEQPKDSAGRRDSA